MLYWVFWTDHVTKRSCDQEIMWLADHVSSGCSRVMYYIDPDATATDTTSDNIHLLSSELLLNHSVQKIILTVLSINFIASSVQFTALWNILHNYSVILQSLLETGSDCHCHVFFLFEVPVNGLYWVHYHVHVIIWSINTQKYHTSSPNNLM